MSGASARPPRSPRALAALLLVTILWGFTFVWMKQSLEAAARVFGGSAGSTAVLLYVSIRFLAAAAILAIWPKTRQGLDRGAWRSGIFLGALLAVGFLFQMLGLEKVTPPVSAFLTSLYVVFAAILTIALHKHRPHLPLIAGIVLATLGAGFIEGPPHLTFGLPEWLTVGCAAIFAVHIIATDRLTKAHPPLAVTLTSFIATGVVAAAGLGISLTRTGAPTHDQIRTLLHDAGFFVPLALATIFATVFALTLMNVFQRELDPVRASILYALEPIWTTIIAFFMGLGRPGFWLWIGGGALIAGNLIAELEIAAEKSADRGSK